MRNAPQAVRLTPKTSAERLAAVAEPSPTGAGAIVLDSVIQALSNLVGSRVIPYLAFEPLRDDLLARAEVGEKKYGTKLRVNNGRKAIVDLYQEVTDAMMYSMQARLEGDHKAGRYFEILSSVASMLAAELNVRP